LRCGSRHAPLLSIDLDRRQDCFGSEVVQGLGDTRAHHSPHSAAAGKLRLMPTIECGHRRHLLYAKAADDPRPWTANRDAGPLRAPCPQVTASSVMQAAAFRIIHFALGGGWRDDHRQPTCSRRRPCRLDEVEREALACASDGSKSRPSTSTRLSVFAEAPSLQLLSASLRSSRAADDLRVTERGNVLQPSKGDINCLSLRVRTLQPSAASSLCR